MSPWVVEGHTAPPEATHYSSLWSPFWYYFDGDMLYLKDAQDADDDFDPRPIDEEDRNILIPSMISRPSTQQ